jgi:hypothetical protein
MTKLRINLNFSKIKIVLQTICEVFHFTIWRSQFGVGSSLRRAKSKAPALRQGGSLAQMLRLIPVSRLEP